MIENFEENNGKPVESETSLNNYSEFFAFRFCAS